MTNIQKKNFFVNSAGSPAKIAHSLLITLIFGFSHICQGDNLNSIFPVIPKNQQTEMRDYLESQINLASRIDDLHQRKRLKGNRPPPPQGRGTESGGGGGSGIVCLQEESRYSEYHQILPIKLESKDYENIYWGTTLDLANMKDTYEPTRPEESSLAYLERILTKNYKPLNKIFIDKLLIVIRHFYKELDRQKTEKKNHSSGLKYIDDVTFNWSFDMLKGLRLDIPSTNDNHKGTCTQPAYVQLAIRYTSVERFKSQLLLVDFDTQLLALLKKRNPKDATAIEASLVLHESVYFMAEMMGHQSATMTTKFIVPMLLAANTESEKDISTLRTLFMHRLADYNLLNYPFLVSFEEEDSIANHQVKKHFQATQKIGEIIRRISKNWPAELGEIRTIFGQENQDYNERLMNEFLAEEAPQVAFMALAKCASRNSKQSFYQYSFDDLFQEDLDQNAVEKSICSHFDTYDHYEKFVYKDLYSKMKLYCQSL